MIKYLISFSDYSIKLLQVNIETREILLMNLINKEDIRRIEFNSYSKQAIFYFKNNETYECDYNYYDRILNYFTPRFEWDEID